MESLLLNIGPEKEAVKFDRLLLRKRELTLYIKDTGVKESVFDQSHLISTLVSCL